MQLNVSNRRYSGTMYLVSNNQVRWRGAIALSEAVAMSPVIRSVILRHNPIGTAAGLHLGLVLARKSGAPCLVDIQVGHEAEIRFECGVASGGVLVLKCSTM